MKCDKCENESTVHEVTIKGGKRHEKHLCERCARDQGMAVQAAPITELLTQFVTAQSALVKDAPQSPPANECSVCGQTYASFRSSGLLGCPKCYEVFEGQLGPLLSRAHEGGTHHAGKRPHGRAVVRETAVHHAPGSTEAGVGAGAGERAAMSVSIQQSSDSAPADAARHAARESRVAALKQELQRAIDAEQYERAAAVRDELARMASEGAGEGACESSAQTKAKAKRKSSKGGDAGGESGGTGAHA